MEGFAHESRGTDRARDGRQRRARAGDRARARAPRRERRAHGAADRACSSRWPPRRGGRAIACDLDRPRRARAAGRGGRSGRRARRQRGHPGQRPHRVVQRRGDRPGARRQPARADDPRAADVRGHGGARRRPHRLRVVAERQGGHAARSSVYAATKFGLRGFAHGAARGSAAARRRRLDGVPGLHPRRRHVPRRPAPSCPATSAPRRPRTSPTPSCRAIERDRSEVDVAPIGVRLGATLAGLAPEAVGDRPAQARRRRDRARRSRPASATSASPRSAAGGARRARGRWRARRRPRRAA